MAKDPLPEKRFQVTSSVSVKGAGEDTASKPNFQLSLVEDNMKAADAAQREIDGARTAIAGLIAYWRTQGLKIDDDGVVDGASPSA